MSTHTQFFWPLTNGKVFAAPDNAIIDLAVAYERGLTCAGASMLRREMDAEVNGVGASNGSMWAVAAHFGTTIDYGFDAASHKAKFEASQRQIAEAAKPPKTERQKQLAARKAAPATGSATPAPQALSPWAAAILESEEALLRPDATATLLSIHDGSTMSAARATALLGALPIEAYHFNQPTTEDQMATLNATAAVVRAAEIRHSALNLRGERGDAAALAESKRLASALHSHRAGVDIGAALHAAGADVQAVADIAKRAA